MHAITLVLRNRIKFKRYSLDQDSVRGIRYFVEMATWYFHTGSHKFTQYWVIDHDRMTTVTLQTTYDHTLSFVYPKVACLHEISSGSGIYSDVVSDLSAAQHRQRGDRSTTSMLFTVTSSSGHVNHVTTIMRRLSFAELRNPYCPQTMHFSKQQQLPLRSLQTPLIVRDWGNNGTICISTCSRTMPPIAVLIKFNDAIWRH